MKKLYLYEILNQIGGTIISSNKKNILIDNVTVESNKIKNNTLFIYKNIKRPMNWQNLSELHSYAIITDNPQSLLQIGNGAVVIQVENIKETYNKFVEFYRLQFDLPIIGITGTTGKTSTKEMIKWILKGNKTTQTTINSKNGLNKNLKYLLGIDEKTEVAIFEMGVAWPGNIMTYCAYFLPTIGIITTIGTDHLLGCKNQENYVKEKFKLIDGMQNKGTIILNKDNKYINQYKLDSFIGKVIYFGVHEEVDFKGGNIKYSNGGMTFTLQTGNRSFDCYIPGVGKHHVYNALAAIATVSTLGIPIEYAIKRLKLFPQLEHRMQIVQGIKGSTIIDDTWSTNVTSTKNALVTLKDIGRDKKKIAVLGPMTRMGKKSLEIHKKIAELVISSHVDILVTVGSETEIIAKTVQEINRNIVTISCENSNVAVKELLPFIDSDTIILLKVEYDYKPLLHHLIQKNQEVI